ncbi:hypothetical protein GQ53DRAFT_889849 [Thozetella sp. PMI_491]|nr:hypothetical protein GQ53DRAFT_889849 [Thozetella sp. PMI_491]
MASPPPRSCDRCHSIKELCRWIPGSAECQRCARLGHSCATVRQVKRAGRRPQSTPQMPQLHPSLHVLEGSDVLAGVPKSECQLVSRMLSVDENLEQFLMGPSFCNSHRQLLISSFVSHGSILKDAVLACSTAWLGASEELDCSYRKASSALTTLYSFEVKDEDDMAICLALGASLHTFALKLRVNDISAICSQTLGRIKVVYEANPQIEPDRCFMLTCMVNADIFECLLLGQAPSLRYQPPTDPNYVDRFAGLCTTLLPLLQDICELNNALTHADETDKNDIMNSLDALEVSVRNWRPSVPSRFISRFTASETAHIICQAEVMRMAALLIIHRLVHPFGSNDEPAAVLASAIMNQLVTTHLVTEKPVRCAELAIVVAYLEFQGGERLRWLQKLQSLVGFSAEYKQRVQNIILSAWMAKDGGMVSSWYNLAGVVSPVPVQL